MTPREDSPRREAALRDALETGRLRQLFSVKPVI
nr:MAG TPA: hypothetical protein [Caudoviricetes sp.]